MAILSFYRMFKTDTGAATLFSNYTYKNSVQILRLRYNMDPIYEVYSTENMHSDRGHTFL